MRDFWRDSGYHLLDRTPEGRLVVSDDFLRAYLRRPEMAPVEDSCAAERALHAAMLEDPRQAVATHRLSELADPDVRENYRIFLAFRDRLLRSATIEDCYLRIFGPSDQANAAPPPLFLDHLVHAILRNILEGCEDPLRLRAAELLFREQTITLHDGAIMAADSETVEMFAAGQGYGSLGQLLVQSQTPLRSLELDVLNEENAEIYWARESRHDTALALNFMAPGLDALARVLEAWVAHFFAVGVSIQPVQQISDEHWVWHIGLDIEGSRLLNDLYNGVEVDESRMQRLLSLFRLDFADPNAMRADIAGRPVYLAMAMTEDSRLRLKPQNLLVNLPLAQVV